MKHRVKRFGALFGVIAVAAFVAAASGKADAEESAGRKTENGINLAGVSDNTYGKPLDYNDEGFHKVRKAFSPSPMSADYIQTRTIQRIGKTLESSGKMVVLPGTGIAWMTEKPYASTMVVGRTGVTQRVGTRVTRLDASKNQTYLSMAEVLESVFTGDFSRTEETFDAFFDSGGVTGRWRLTLIPKDTAVKTFVHSIAITGAEAVGAVLLTEVSGDTTLYTLENVEQRELNADETQAFFF